MKALLIVLLVGFLSACAVQAPVDNWPAEIPSRDFFNQQWLGDAPNQALQSQADYLLWVRRFYEGYNLVPGWMSMMQQVNARIPAGDRMEVHARLYELGNRIGSEWAKDNSVRKLNTRTAAIWRDALLEALAQDDLYPYLDRLQQDVDGLMSGQLDNADIRFDRYYVDEFDF